MATASRREALRARLAGDGLDALLVTTLVNVRYLTGFTGSTARLLVRADGDDRFVTDGRYAEQAEGQVPDIERVVTRFDDWLTEAAAGPLRLGVESHTMPWDTVTGLAELLPEADVVAAAGHVEALREVKDSDELAALSSACELAGRAFTAVTAALEPGLSERRVAITLERAMVDAGADAAAFETIVASGPNGARPHHRAGERLLQRGDVVTIDFGALVDGYHSDCTRMLSLGSPDPGLAAVVALVAAAQRAGLEALADGVEAKAVDAACRDLITAAGHGEHFEHGTGHGVGLEVHEAPRVAKDASARMRSGMVVTVEPGIYLPGSGGARIEDTVIVCPGGPTVLTDIPKDLLVL